ncbi:hypothetical protein ACFL1H_00100 [Nanoarchaeota archaeon]
MVLVKILGLLDLCSAIIILLLEIGLNLPWNLTIAAALYLFGKAYMFKGDISSMLDGAIGVYHILLLFGFHSILGYIIFVYFLEKTYLSLFS